jgi:hypothetical protein
VEGSGEHGNKTSGSIECWQVREWLHNRQLFQKGSAPYVCKCQYSQKIHDRVKLKADFSFVTYSITYCHAFE